MCTMCPTMGADSQLLQHAPMQDPMLNRYVHTLDICSDWFSTRNTCMALEQASNKRYPFKKLDLSSYDKIMLCCQHLSFDWNVKVDQLWLQISNVSSPCARWQPAWVDVVEIHLSVTNHCPKIGFAAAAQSSEMLWIDMECSNIGAWYCVKICVCQCKRSSKKVGSAGDCCVSLPPCGWH